MKNTWLTITIIGACAALSANARAGDESFNSSSNETSHTWSSRHLSATGRSPDQSVRASQLRGAAVQDSSGAQIGQIQDLIVNPSSGRIDFAVITLSGQGGASSPSGSSYGNSQNQKFGNQATAGTGSSTATSSATEESTASVNTSSSGKMVPVPWSLLKPASGSEQYASGSRAPQSFTLNVDQSRLNGAPALDRGNSTELGQSGWRQRIYSYYGVSESASGAAESPSGSQKGHEAEKLIEPQNP